MTAPIPVILSEAEGPRPVTPAQMAPDEVPRLRLGMTEGGGMTEAAA